MDTNEARIDTNSYPVFKGLGRKPTFMGLPTNLLLGTFICVAFIAMTIGLIWWLLLVVMLPVIAIMTREDEKAFDVLWLELKTRTRNRNKAFWQGSSYAPSGYDTGRPWRRLINNNRTYQS